MVQQPLPSGALWTLGVSCRSVGGMLKEVPGVVTCRLGHPGPCWRARPDRAPWRTTPQTPQEWEAALLPIQQQFETGVNAIPGLMAGPAWGKAGYGAGETLLSKLARVANVPAGSNGRQCPASHRRSRRELSVTASQCGHGH